MLKSVICLLAGGVGGCLIGNFSNRGSAVAGAGDDPPEVKVVSEVLEGSRSSSMKQLLRAELDPWGALAAIESDVQQSVWHMHRNAQRKLFQSWAQRDLEGAIRALGSVSHSSRYDAVKAVLEVAFEQDPERAIQVMKEWHLFAGLPAWLKENPLQAIEHFSRIASGQDGADHFSFPKALAQVDPKAGLDWALSLSGERRRTMVKEMIAAWAQVDLEGAVAAYGDGSGFDWRVRRDFEMQIPQGLSRHDPMAALGWLEEVEMEPRDRENTRAKILREWSRRDLDGAIEWVRELPILSKKQAMGTLVTAWARQDVGAAAEFYLSVGSENQYDSLAATRIADVYLKEDPVAALDWIDRLPMGTRWPLERKAFQTLSKSDRELAVAELASRLPRLSPPTLEKFSAEFFKSDVEAARDWFESLSHTRARQIARKGLELASKEKDGEGLRSVLEEL